MFGLRAQILKFACGMWHGAINCTNTFYIFNEAVRGMSVEGFFKPLSLGGVFVPNGCVRRTTNLSFGIHRVPYESQANIEAYSENRKKTVES
jgi:hypothetical protein